jgi:hypothetical protein
VVGMIKELKEFGIKTSGFDPLLGRKEIEAFGIDAAEGIKGMGADYVIMAVVCDAFKKTFHKSFIKNCPSGGVCFYIFLYVKVVKRWKQKV